jgi:hypothetical protein
VELRVSSDEDPLAFFDPEIQPGSVHEFPAGSPIVLDQVLERRTAVFWAEAVAIVNAVCALLINGKNEKRAPEHLRNIKITPAGTVLVDVGKTEGLPGPRLARILLELTASAAAPVPLRLFITKWASCAEAHSVADYAQALGHFARPNGPELIRAVYERCVAAAPVTQRRPEPEPDAAAANPPPAHSKRLRYTWLIAGAATASALSATGVWLWSDWMATQPGAADIAHVHRIEASAVATSQSQTATNRTPEQGLAFRNGTTPATGVGRIPIIGRSATASINRPPNVSPIAGLASPMPAADVPAPLSAIVVDGSTSMPLRVPIAAGDDPGAPEIPSNSRSTADSTRIYSGADPDVTPPIFIDASLPPPLLSDVRELNTMEVVISERGLVERVRLVSKPRRMADMMLLSGAKTWKFEPASKDGVSVRYRLLLSWAATP